MFKKLCIFLFVLIIFVTPNSYAWVNTSYYKSIFSGYKSVLLTYSDITNKVMENDKPKTLIVTGYEYQQLNLYQKSGFSNTIVICDDFVKTSHFTCNFDTILEYNSELYKKVSIEKFNMHGVMLVGREKSLTYVIPASLLFSTYTQKTVANFVDISSQSTSFNKTINDVVVADDPSASERIVTLIKNALIYLSSNNKIGQIIFTLFLLFLFLFSDRFTKLKSLVKGQNIVGSIIGVSMSSLAKYFLIFTPIFTLSSSILSYPSVFIKTFDNALPPSLHLFLRVIELISGILLVSILVWMCLIRINELNKTHKFTFVDPNYFSKKLFPYCWSLFEIIVGFVFSICILKISLMSFSLVLVLLAFYLLLRRFYQDYIPTYSKKIRVIVLMFIVLIVIYLSRTPVFPNIVDLKSTLDYVFLPAKFNNLPNTKVSEFYTIPKSDIFVNDYLVYSPKNKNIENVDYSNFNANSKGIIVEDSSPYFYSNLLKNDFLRNAFVSKIPTKTVYLSNIDPLSSVYMKLNITCTPTSTKIKNKITTRIFVNSQSIETLTPIDFPGCSEFTNKVVKIPVNALDFAQSSQIIKLKGNTEISSLEFISDKPFIQKYLVSSFKLYDALKVGEISDPLIVYTNLSKATQPKITFSRTSDITNIAGPINFLNENNLLTDQVHLWSETPSEVFLEKLEK